MVTKFGLNTSIFRRGTSKTGAAGSQRRVSEDVRWTVFDDRQYINQLPQMNRGFFVLVRLSGWNGQTEHPVHGCTRCMLKRSMLLTKPDEPGHFSRSSGQWSLSGSRTRISDGLAGNRPFCFHLSVGCAISSQLDARGSVSWCVSLSSSVGSSDTSDTN